MDTEVVQVQAHASECYSLLACCGIFFCFVIWQYLHKAGKLRVEGLDGAKGAEH